MAKLITVVNAVSQASMEIGIAQGPLMQAVGSADEDVAQMTALLSAVASELVLEEPYEETLGDGLWLMSNDGKNFYDSPKADNDLILFDSRLAIEGLKYRFLAAKGLEFGEPLRDYTSRLNKLAVRVNGRVLDLNEDEGPMV